MNVKAGQKAIIIKSFVGNEGKIVEVLEYLGENPVYGAGRPWNTGDGPCWLIQGFENMTNTLGKVFSKAPIPDAWLRPVSDIPDEEYGGEQSKLLENV